MVWKKKVDKVTKEVTFIQSETVIKRQETLESLVAHQVSLEEKKKIIDDQIKNAEADIKEVKKLLR